MYFLANFIATVPTFSVLWGKYLTLGVFFLLTENVFNLFVLYIVLMYLVQYYALELWKILFLSANMATPFPNITEKFQVLIIWMVLHEFCDV